MREAIVAAIVGVVTMAMATGAARGAVQGREIECTQGGVKLLGYLAWDDAKASASQTRPGVIVVPEWWGHNDYARERARQLAELGYVAFAIDMYGKGVLATNREEAQKLAGPFYQDRQLMRARAAAGLEVLRGQAMVDASRLAAIGYCMGGTVALELARSGADLSAVVSFHGGLGTPDKGDARNIKGELLVLNGEADPMVSRDERKGFLEEMNAAGVRYNYVELSGAVHAFTRKWSESSGIPGVAYDARADERSWGMLRVFFEQVLR